MKILQWFYSLYVIIVFIIIIVSSFPFVLLILLFKEKQKVKLMHHYLRGVAHVWLFLIGIKPKIYNKELFLANENYVIIANHQSYLDACLVYTAISQVFKSLGKFEISKVPLFGLIYRTTVVLIDRSNNMARARSFIKMADSLKEGLNILVFPEGTFEAGNTNLLPFFEGAFKLALDSSKPILPLIIVDAAKRMHPTSIMKFTPGVSRMVFLPSITTANLKKGDEKQLKNYCYNYLNELNIFCANNNCDNALQHSQQWLNTNKLEQA
jgi:1-acyl-sn-glycerol-3-phosphate acyltransferase